MVRSASTRTVVCFDLGGVLVRICRSWAEACALCGLPVKNPEWLSSAPVRQRRARLVDKYQRGELESGSYYVALSDALDGLYTASQVEQVHRAWTRGEYAGAEALVAELNQQPGVRTACLSNTDAVHWAVLQDPASHPAIGRLRYRLASHLLGCTKPDPRIFAMAAAQLEARPEEIWFFDDLEANVHAARDAGWNAHWIDSEQDTIGQVRSRLPR